MSHPQLLKPLQAGGFVAGIVRFSDAEQIRADPGGERLAELGLAGAGGAVQQDVDSTGAGFQRALQELADVPAGLSEMVEVGPCQLARDGIAEQHTGHVHVVVVRGAGEPQQSLHQLEIVVAVDGYQPGPRQRSPRAEALTHTVGGHAEHAGQNRVAQIEDVHRHTPVDLIQ